MHVFARTPVPPLNAPFKNGIPGMAWHNLFARAKRLLCVNSRQISVVISEKSSALEIPLVLSSKSMSFPVFPEASDTHPLVVPSGNTTGSICWIERRIKGSSVQLPLVLCTFEREKWKVY